MKKERYKRFELKLPYNAQQPTKIEDLMNDAIEGWINNTMQQPGNMNFEYRIINAETNTVMGSSYMGQTIAPTIRYVVHIAYTL